MNDQDAQPARSLIAEGREKLAAATPGPWEVAEEIDGVRAGCSTVIKAGSGPERARVVTVDQTRRHHYKLAEQNIELIVWMRNNLPTLLDAAEKLARMQEEFDTALAGVRKYVETGMDELRHHRKVVGMDREGNPEFQYSHDQARYEVLGNVRSILTASGWEPPRTATITTLINLDAQPVGTLVREEGGQLAFKTAEYVLGTTDDEGYRSEWALANDVDGCGTYGIDVPVAVLWAPEEADRG